MIFLGSCEKYDLVIAVASLVKSITKEEVAIVTDSDHSYRYFKGEVSGIEILKTPPTDFDGKVIYDCYKVIIPDVEDQKIVLVTSLDRPTYETSIEFARSFPPTALVVLQEDCLISEKVLNLNFGTVDKILNITNSPGRRIDMLHEELVNFKKLDNEFKDVSSEITSMFLGMEQKEVRKYWETIEKSSYGAKIKKKWGFG